MAMAAGGAYGYGRAGGTHGYRDRAGETKRAPEQPGRGSIEVLGLLRFWTNHFRREKKVTTTKKYKTHIRIAST
jgi:hypothetical protein